jgi:hypothetical protein
MLQLSEKWAPRLRSQGETGMSYQICTIVLKDGRRIEGVTIVGGIIAKIKGLNEVPFGEDEIDDIVVTHAR